MRNGASTDAEIHAPRTMAASTLGAGGSVYVPVFASASRSVLPPCSWPGSANAAHYGMAPESPLRVMSGESTGCRPLRAPATAARGVPGGDRRVVAIPRAAPAAGRLPHAFARQSFSACSKIERPRSISASVMVIGGAMRNTPQPPRMTLVESPRSRQRRMTACVRSGAGSFE